MAPASVPRGTIRARDDDVQSGWDGPTKSREMASLDERVAYLEGRMEDHTALMTDIRGEMRDLRADMRAEMRDLRTEMDRRFDRIDRKTDRQFMWLVGMLVGVLTGLGGLAFQIARL
jgi:hypothetical protein